MLGGGGVDGCIHRAAGPGLLAECRTLGGCKVGQAKITHGYRLPCKYVIHTVGPIYQDGYHHEKELLTSCYQSSMEMAKRLHCETVAFPMISAGVYGYPWAEALHVAVDTISKFLMNNDMTVTIVIFDRREYRVSESLFDDVNAYIDRCTRIAARNASWFETEAQNRSIFTPDDRRNVVACSSGMDGLYANESQPEAEIKETQRQAAREELPLMASEICFQSARSEGQPKEIARPEEIIQPKAAKKENPLKKENQPKAVPKELGEALKRMDESFSEMLLRKIDESGMTDAQCYRKANIDRRLFSKIRSDREYRPSKPTVIAFAVALQLSLQETLSLLEKAGFTLSHASKFDIIVEYFIANRRYNVFELNEVLFAYDMPLIGA